MEGGMGSQTNPFTLPLPAEVNRTRKTK